jgi:hypothetical protein
MANVLLAPEVFIEGDDFAGSALKGDFRDQVIGEPHATFAGSLQGSTRQPRRLNPYTSRSEKAVNGTQHPSSVPSAAKHPGQLGKNKKGHKYAVFRTSLRESGARSLRLRGIVVQIRPGPHVGIGCEHYHSRRDFAAFISSKVIRA